MAFSHVKLSTLVALSLLIMACPSEEQDGPGSPSPIAKDMAGQDLTNAPDQRKDQADMPPKDLGAPPDMAPDQGGAKDLGSDLAGMNDMAPAPDMTPPPDMNMGLPGGPSSARQRAVLKSMTQAKQGFYEYLPPGYGDAKKRPLLVFFHGVGENGDGEGQLNKVLANGPPKLIKNDKWPEDRTFIVLSPQHTGNNNCPGADEIRDFLSFATTNYDVDLNRVYLTGLSCGAIGLWNYLGKYSDDVAAAAVPIAGDGKGAFNRIDCELGLVPLWAFHGDNDTRVVPSGTNTPVDGLLDGHCPSPPRKEVKKTIYPGVGHDSWSRTYDLSAGHDIYTWLMSKRR